MVPKIIPKTHSKEMNVLVKSIHYLKITRFGYLAVYFSRSIARSWSHTTYLSKSAFS